MIPEAPTSTPVALSVPLTVADCAVKEPDTDNVAETTDPEAVTPPPTITAALLSAVEAVTEDDVKSPLSDMYAADRPWALRGPFTTRPDEPITPPAALIVAVAVSELDDRVPAVDSEVAVTGPLAVTPLLPTTTATALSVPVAVRCCAVIVPLVDRLLLVAAPALETEVAVKALLTLRPPMPTTAP